MASVAPVEEKQLMDVKLGELLNWILMWDFIPKGTAGAFQKGYTKLQQVCQCEKGSIIGISVVLAVSVSFNYCLSYKDLKHERLCKYY
ncbi:ATP synthase subunit f, mitochondrial-like [Meles meles]|uniref:ATP synthase subunit f, mitochondrial-like n=1 Tax=Meles meles TaxID=9662 RepID=UPI001E6992C8|nr:ATP synthase subunit f, mitochondrial-like [Meles meles]